MSERDIQYTDADNPNNNANEPPPEYFTSTYTPPKQRKIGRAEAERIAIARYAKASRMPPHKRAGTRFALTPDRAVFVKVGDTHITGRIAVGGYLYDEGHLFQGAGALSQIAHLKHKPPLLSVHAETMDYLIRHRTVWWEMIDLTRNEVWRISMADAVAYGFGYSAKLGTLGASTKRWGVPLNRCRRFTANWTELDAKEFDQVDVPVPPAVEKIRADIDAGQSHFFDL